MILLSDNKDIAFIQNYIADFESIKVQPEMLSQFVAVIRDHAGNVDFVNSLFQSLGFSKDDFREVCLTTEVLLEKTMAIDVLQGQHNALELRIEKAWDSHVKEASIFSEYTDHVHMLGSGAIPLTAMIYHESAALKISCIDYDAEALEQSKAIAVARYGVNRANKHFEFIQADAAVVNLGKNAVSAVLLASHCDKKLLILKNMHRQLVNKGRVICRSPKLLYQSIYSALNLAALTGYRLINNPEWQLGESPVLLPSKVLEKTIAVE